MEFLKHIFGPTDFRPHGYCYLWNTNLVWLHVISDALIALSYFAIPAVLVWFVRKRRDLPFNWMFMLFGVFIVACGMTHVMEIWTLWHADYWISGSVKVVTAISSVSTAGLLINLAPRVLALPGIENLLRAKATLENQVRELRQDEAESQIRESMYREEAELLNLTHDAIFVCDVNGRIKYWNRSAELLYGWSKEEARGQISHDLLRTMFPQPRAEIAAQVITGTPWEGELIHTHRNGSRVTVDSRWALQRDDRGKPCGILETNRDITQRKYLEKRFEKLLEAAPDAIVIVGKRGKIDLVNAQAETLFGYKRSELIGQPVEILVPAQLRGVHEKHRHDYAQSPRPRTMGASLDLCGRRKDGSEFPVEISLSPIETEQGMLVATAIRDTTLRRETLEKIRNLNMVLEGKVAELDTANREMETFSYSVSHDLRAPLRHIDGYARILQEEHHSALPEDARRCLARITEAANRMGRLIDDLLALGRVGRSEMNWQVASLNELVKQAMADLPPETGDRQIEWHIESLGKAQCDPGLVRLVFFNLLANAVKFTRKNPSASIQIGKLDGHLTPTYFIRDNGVGFEKKYADKLFGVFQRLHREQDFEGTGIGLATVRRILQRHGGDIWAESEAGQGATFFFALGPNSTGEELSSPSEAERDGSGVSGNPPGGG